MKDLSELKNVLPDGGMQHEGGTAREATLAYYAGALAMGMLPVADWRRRILTTRASDVVDRLLSRTGIVGPTPVPECSMQSVKVIQYRHVQGPPLPQVLVSWQYDELERVRREQAVATSLGSYVCTVTGAHLALSRMPESRGAGVPFTFGVFIRGVDSDFLDLPAPAKDEIRQYLREQESKYALAQCTEALGAIARRMGYISPDEFRLQQSNP